MLYVPSQAFLKARVYLLACDMTCVLERGDVSWLAAGKYPLNGPSLTHERSMWLSRTHTGTSGACGARSLLGETYRATPVGCELGSHPPTLNLPRHTVADHHLPKVLLKDGLSDDFHSARTVTKKKSRLGFTARDVTIFNLSI